MGESGDEQIDGKKVEDVGDAAYDPDQEDSLSFSEDDDAVVEPLRKSTFKQVCVNAFSFVIAFWFVCLK